MVENKAIGTPQSYMNSKSSQRDIKTYIGVHPDAQLLDRQLFRTLKTIVTGSLLSIISQLTGVTGQYACYTSDIIAIWQHHRLSSATRKLSTMTRMQELQYHGDADKWKLDFIERAAKVFQSEVTLQYWMVNCAFKSFEGKNTQVQSMMVENINNKEVVCSNMNVDARAIKYAEYLSTLNAGQVVNKVNAQSDYHDRPHGKAKNKTNGSSGSSKPKQGELQHLFYFIRRRILLQRQPFGGRSAVELSVESRSNHARVSPCLTSVSSTRSSQS